MPRIIASLVFATGLVAAATACGPESNPNTGAGTGVETPAASSQMTIAPARGISGTTATVTVTGADPGSLVSVSDGLSSFSGTADADGVASVDITFSGPPGPITVIASSAANVELSRGEFVVIDGVPESTLPPTPSTTTTTSTIPDPNPPAPQVAMTVTPSSGPAGTQDVDIIVTGPAGEAVTIFIRGQQAQTGGVTDTNGRYVFTTTFSGADGEVIPVRAEMEVAGQAGSADGTYTITPSVPPPTTTEPGSGSEPISLLADDLVLTEFHDTANLPPALLEIQALSALFAQLSEDVGDEFDQLFLVVDENGTGVLDDGDVVSFPPQDILDDGPTPLPIDIFAVHFVGAVPTGWAFPDAAIGAPLDGLERLDDGSWALGAGGDPVIFADGFESGDVAAWSVDGTPEIAPTAP